jgi:hypothetical protein
VNDNAKIATLGMLALASGGGTVGHGDRYWSSERWPFCSCVEARKPPFA